MAGMNEFDVAQASRFFSEWAALQSSPPQEDQYIEWRTFFFSWERLPQKHVEPSSPPMLNSEEFKLFAQAYANPYRHYRQSGLASNVWRAAGLGHDELRNSQVLSWVLDKFADHGQGSAILERLIELAGRQRPVDVTPNDVRNNNYWTRTESQPLGDCESRVDIEIECPAFLIFIEVKIRAAETSDQLKRYVNLVRIKAAGRPSIVVFLTPNGRSPSNDDLREEIVPLSWKQVAKILDTHTPGDLGSSFSGQIFRQFADHLRHLA